MSGSLVSRLNSDVIGAQRALTGTLSSVVSNLLTLIIVLTTMIVLSWQITVVALLLVPIFVLPAKYVGRRLQKVARDQMKTRRRDERDDDRAVQCRRDDARQAVRAARAGVGGVLPPRGRRPRHGRAAGDVQHGVLHRAHVYATNAPVDGLEGKIDTIREDLDALTGTVTDILVDQRWTRANLGAVMVHLGVPEVTAPDDL